MYFAFFDDNGNLQLSKLPLWKSIIALIFGRDVCFHVKKKDVIIYLQAEEF